LTTTKLLAVTLAMSTYTATAADWPPTLNPNPAVQPPKWDWQLATPVKLNPDTSIKIYDIDMFENEKDTTVQTPHSNGYKAICYPDVGSWENWRDEERFPQNHPRRQILRLPRRKWLDIRDVNPHKSATGAKLAQILLKRLDRAQRMGCDAIEPDNIDGYDKTAHEATGFPLTYEDQIYFNLWLADNSHARGMLIALKNNINQARI
jgi:hypothetical protein